LLLAPDDPEVCGLAPEQRYRLHRKRATMSMLWLLLSATALGHHGSRPWPPELAARLDGRIDLAGYRSTPIPVISRRRPLRTPSGHVVDGPRGRNRGEALARRATAPMTLPSP
jgi:hypothetical protein